jgi:hypothetical protein
MPALARYFSRFFSGSNRVSAAEPASLAARNQNRIRKIRQLMNTEKPDTDTRAMPEEQLRIMELENTRSGQVTSTGQQSHGLPCWFRK